MVFVIDGCEVVRPGGKSVYRTVRLHRGLDRVGKIIVRRRKVRQDKVRYGYGGYEGVKDRKYKCDMNFKNL